MKKIRFLIIIIGIVNIIIGLKLYIDNEEKQRFIKTEIITSVEKLEAYIEKTNTVINKNRTKEEYDNKIEKLLKSLKREEFENLFKEIEKIEYEDIKESLLNRKEEIENKIILEEERIEEEKRKKEEEARKNEINNASKDIVEVFNGNISAYTPYCSDGCHGYTASGRFVGNNIYYDDKEYGTVRIVAADPSLPFGTIVRFKNMNYFGKDIYAIVLDRGGAIGHGRRVLFDLLFETENEANRFGINRNVTCEVLRLGY
ncbi:MAG: hypothetical protein IJ568_00860 [Bacilli bacterium]|nr:hypothetical protein [Bacilli bacterium]